MTQKQIAAYRKRIEKRQQKAYADLEELQVLCKHPGPTKKYGSSTGNWDLGDDRWWIDWACPDCGKKWTTAQ